MAPPLAPAPAPVVVRVPHPIAGEIPPGLRKRLKSHFVYALEFLPLAASATETDSFNVEADSDFVIVSAEAVVTSEDNATLIAFPSILVEMKETGSGRTLSNISVPMISRFGTGSAPALWWKDSWAQRLRASSTFQVTLQNLTATAMNVRLAFCGFKVWNILENAEDT